MLYFGVNVDTLNATLLVIHNRTWTTKIK